MRNFIKIPLYGWINKDHITYIDIPSYKARLFKCASSNPYSFMVYFNEGAIQEFCYHTFSEAESAYRLIESFL